MPVTSFTDLHVVPATNLGVVANGSNPITITPTANPASISGVSVDGFLTTDNVVLDTTASPSNSQSGDIDVDSGASINWTTSKSLTFNAAGAIGINDTITGANGTLVLDAGHGIAQSSAISVATLSGSAGATVALTNAANSVGSLGDFTVSSGDFSLTDTVALLVTGALSAANVTLSGTSISSTIGGTITATVGLTVTDSGDGTFNDVISGGTFTKDGAGIVTLAATEAYTGATLVSAGTLLVDGSIASSNLTTVASGATLGGHGTIGALTVDSGGNLSPGDSPGILTTGDLTLSSGSNFNEEIGGTGQGNYDQVQVHGDVSLGGATLNATTFGSFFLDGSETNNFTIIDNQGSNPVSGTFAGLAEGATLTIGGANFVITYQGGDGNDVVLLAANDLPVLSGLGDTSFYTENGPAVALDSNNVSGSLPASVSDAELNTFASFDGATLVLQRHGGANPDDVFSSVGSGTGALDLDHSNGIDNVSLDGGATFIGRFTEPGDGTFTITFNSNASRADIDSVLQQLGYSNLSDNPPESVQIDFTFSDGNGQEGGQNQGAGAKPGTTTASVTVEINQVDDAPGLVNVAPSAAYGVGTSGAVLAPGLGIFDPDATPPSLLTGLAGATIQIASGFLAGDALFVNLATDLDGHFITPDNVTTGISVQSNSGGTLMLVGNDSVSNYQQILDAVSYKSSAADPTNGGTDPHRAITWLVSDGSLSSPTPVTDPNDPNFSNTTILHFDVPPVLDLDASASGTGFTASFTENGTGIGIVDSDVSITDSDTAEVNSATITLTNAKAGDSLSIAGSLPGGIDSSIDTSVAGKITVHLLNSASLADYQTALRQITFVNSSDAPDATDRDITVVVSDGEVDSNTAHATVHVIPVNDAPVVNGAVALASIDASATPRLITQSVLLSNASDVDGPSLTATNLAIASGVGTLVDNHDGTWSYTPSPGGIGTSVSFSYQVTDGSASVADTAHLDITGSFTHPKPPTTPLPNLIGTSGNDSFTATPGNERIDGGGGIDTVTFNFKLVDANISFSGNQVIIDGPTGSHTVLTGFETYVFTDGTVNDNDGNPLVDDLYYYSQYHDVWNAHVDADTHYNTFGWHENRNPNAFFSTSFYLSAYPDVKAAGINPLTHYDTLGWKEARDPSILFDTNAYLKANTDVAAAHVDPLAHFLQFGEQEGREPIAPTSIIAANGFDYVYYLQHNPDVAAAGVDPFLHYETIGWKEGRDPNAYFDDKGYLANYPDVAAAGVNPLDHYDTFGWKEGRDPSVNFDTTSYLAAYPDVAAAHIDPLKHFLQFGLAEGRSSFADGVWG